MSDTDRFRLPAFISCLLFLTLLLIAGGMNMPSVHAPSQSGTVEDSQRGLTVELGPIGLELDGTERAEPWEQVYVRGISIIGALVVLLRGIDGWRINTETMTIEPRERPLHEEWTDG